MDQWRAPYRLGKGGLWEWIALQGTGKTISGLYNLLWGTWEMNQKLQKGRLGWSGEEQWYENLGLQV